jgi:hypothetical protein
MSGMTTWQQERRQDQLTRAQIDRERDTARAQLKITGRREALKLRRDERLARTSTRQQSRKARAARRAARTAWLRGHTVDLLFVPVIVVPAVLAWTAMAAYGSQIYGPAGLALPAFSEGAMWAFAAATTITRRRHPDRPLWHLRAGTVVFAGIGAALNFAHAMTAPPGGHAAGPVTGVVYAVVSVAGVTVHQMVTAGPRRSHAERHQARADRAGRRRESAARRAALRDAVAALDEHGNATLVFEPGMAEVARHWGRTRLMLLTPAGPRLAASGPSCPWPAPVPVLTPVPDAAAGVSAAAQVTREERQPEARPDASGRPAVTRQPKPARRVSKAEAGRVRAEAVIKANPQMSRADQARKARVSESTIDRVKRDMADASEGKLQRPLHAVGK